GWPLDLVLDRTAVALHRDHSGDHCCVDQLAFVLRRSGPRCDDEITGTGRATDARLAGRQCQEPTERIRCKSTILCDHVGEDVHDRSLRVSPLRDFTVSVTTNPGLTPWATICRPFGAQADRFSCFALCCSCQTSSRASSTRASNSSSVIPLSAKDCA